MHSAGVRALLARSGSSAVERLHRPRFGAPAIASAAGSFTVEILERAGDPLPSAWLLAPEVPEASARDRGWPLALEAARREAIAGELSLVEYRAHAPAAPPPGCYDLVAGAPGFCERAPRAVWLRAGDPAARGDVRVAQVTDLHVGKRGLGDRLARVIADVNALAPDLVLVTGDVANDGSRARSLPEARRLLDGLAAPVAVVPGNHDHGFGVRALFGDRFGRGWRNFARAFHACGLVHLRLGGWDFLGFDSGPSLISPLIRNRGLSREALATLAAELERAHQRGGRGVVLFSHTPSRARLTGSRASAQRGLVGRMSHGARAFERLLLDAGERGQRVLHLTGHTHWSDVFEAERDQRRARLRFVRWDHARLDEGPRAITSRAALINTQSASHAGLAWRANAHGHGFALLTLGDGAPVLDLRRYA